MTHIQCVLIDLCVGLKFYPHSISNALPLLQNARARLKEHILMSEGEKNIKCKGERKILTYTLKAVIGAIYIDQGLEKTRYFLKETLFWNLIQVLI